MATISLWHDMQTDKFFLLNNSTGAMTRVNSNTEYVKEFDPALTGQVSYKERVEYATSKQKPGYMPLKATSLNNKCDLYRPMTQKYEGYSQYPNPRTQPYYNQTLQLKLDPQKKKEIRNQRDMFKADSQANLNLFGYAGVKSYQSTLTFLTDSQKKFGDFKSLQSSQVVIEHKKNANVKTEDQFNKELMSQKWQLEAFKLPVQVEKSNVITKGRFNVKMPSINEQDEKDREIMKLLYPEMYVEKVDPKKAKQQELRRKINRMKEQEMLERNLKNKV